MANKTITMSNVRQIIKLYSQQMGKKKIGERLGMSKNTVKLYIRQFHALKTTKEELFKLSDFELNKLFHPPQSAPASDRMRHLYEFFLPWQDQCVDQE
ncbi:MAG: helix-turn-helix domain-containing protein [Bacteroidetes bacterium]|nr:helix-turn-helix domain-containing protein [Bacteroidota bacterium]